MGMTMIEKILSKHSGQPEVKPGDIVTCKIDWTVHLDLMFAVEGLFETPKKIYNPERQIVIMDHVVPAPTVLDADAGVKARNFVKKFGIPHFYDVGRHGIGHQMIAENGYALPGQILACGDSHTCASGALNCAARGLGPAEMLYVACKGETWYQVGPTIKYILYNSLPSFVSGKDVFLYIAGKYGDAANKNVEFGGPGIANLSIADRQSIATMCAEISAEFATFPYDEKLEEYLKDRAKEPFEPVESDPDASYEAVHEIDLSEIVPYVSLPDFVPNNTKPVTELEGLEINQAYIGSCANGRLEDIEVAANIVKGRKVAPNVRLIVTPASQNIYKEAVKAGYVETLIESGALVTNSTCGACYGGHMGLIGAGERCLSSSTRNFKGRMGSSQSEVMLASPATVAASAITGKITDPRSI